MSFFIIGNFNFKYDVGMWKCIDLLPFWINHFLYFLKQIYKLSYFIQILQSL